MGQLQTAPEPTSTSCSVRAWVPLECPVQWPAVSFARAHQLISRVLDQTCVALGVVFLMCIITCVVTNLFWSRFHAQTSSTQRHFRVADIQREGRTWRRLHKVSHPFCNCSSMWCHHTKTAYFGVATANENGNLDFIFSHETNNVIDRIQRGYIQGNSKQMRATKPQIYNQ